MKKLLALVMAVLPFVGWTADVNETNIPIAVSITTNDLVRALTNVTAGMANGKTRLARVNDIVLLSLDAATNSPPVIASPLGLFTDLFADDVYADILYPTNIIGVIPATNLPPTGLLINTRPIETFDDFFENMWDATRSTGPFGFSKSIVNTGADVLAGLSSNAPGVVQMTTGTTAMGMGAIISQPKAFCLSTLSGWTNQWRFKLSPTASVAADQYEVFMGLGSGAMTVIDTPPSYCVYCVVNTNAPTFKLLTRNLTLQGTNDTGVTVDSNIWYSVKLVVSSTNSVSMTVTDCQTFTNTVSTNIVPFAVAVGVNAGIIKTNGTTPKIFELDYCFAGYTVTNSVR